MEPEGPRDAPTRLSGILKHLGPGLILAGSIVGSGELIATTRTGAEAGFSFLWLILLGCVIKVFTQVELARHCITHGETTVSALNRMPGPKLFLPLGKRGKAGGHITAIFWLITFLTGLGQLGGIVGGVGQALAISFPLTEAGRTYNAAADQLLAEKIAAVESGEAIGKSNPSTEGSQLAKPTLPPVPPDAAIWSAVLTVVTIVMLVRGGFGFIEVFCIFLVGTFTFTTVGNLVALQFQGDWAIHGSDLLRGFGLGGPEAGSPGVKGSWSLVTAMAAFGIIGVGAAELVAYPYWCLEKGYGRWTGPRDESPAWASRARGWMRVMQWDAWGSMVIYTTSTLAFYLLGAAVLHPNGLLPEKSEMVRTLAVMYEPVFGTLGRTILLIGAFAVLFSTFFVSNATKSRLMTDALDVFGFVKLDEDRRRRFVKGFSVGFPLLCLAIYLFYPRPVFLIAVSGLMQALLLPLLGIAALYFRYQTIDSRLKPGRLWDLLLIFSVLCFTGLGLYLAISAIGGS